ncbi:MAG: radical SAM protein, partial [Bacteroidetes bacterium]|nr:radical SAM protein [Bacteroidota bacterium]
ENISNSEIRLMPFYYMLSRQYHDDEAKRKVLSYIYKLSPGWLKGGRKKYEDYLELLSEKVMRIIDEELAAIDLNSLMLFGISYKLFQWIPGMILASEVKKRAPHIKIVVGGLGNKDSAVELMRCCPDFDYAIWGEGEYPLLELCNHISTQRPQPEKIARLVYREETKIKVSATTRSEYLDFNNYIFPDYADYMPHYPSLEKNLIFFPINSLRSCHWKKCNFCNYNHGYKYRERSPENIVKEIEYVGNKYSHKHFLFVDNDVIGTSIERFEELLDQIIELQKRSNNAFYFWCEMIPQRKLNQDIIKKMANARFGELFVGYEGITDDLLKKMNKSNDFALNIFMIKSALKNDIILRTNLIKGVPDETKEDVLESAENLHYLRFFFHNHKHNLFHIHGNFTLYKEARYYKTLSESEIQQQYNMNPFPYYLPEKMLHTPFNLFGYYKRQNDNHVEWGAFAIAENYYRENEYSYTLEKRGEIIHYEEYLNKEIVESIRFTQQIHCDVLTALNDSVKSFEELTHSLAGNGHKVTDEKLKEVLTQLKAAYLVYFNRDFSSIVSVIDFGY